MRGTGDLLSWLRLKFILHDSWHYTEEDILNMVPYERDILIMLMREKVAEEEKKRQNGNS